MTCTSRSPLPDLLELGNGWARVRVVGRLDERDPAAVDDLRRFVEGGGSLLVVPEPGDAVATGLTGVRVDSALPQAEWFVTLGDGPEAARPDREVPVSAPLHVLGLVGDGVEVVATTSVAFRQVPVLAVRSLGAGRVVSTGVSDYEALLEHRVLGQFVRRLLGRPTLPARTLGVGVVGYGPYGGMGHVHGLAATETEGLAFVAAVDPVAERRSVAAADFPGVRTYASAVDLGDDESVDIAIIATPPSQHADLAVALLRAGKHVVVEKPMCLTLADADRMTAAAEANDRVLTVHQSRRWDTDFLAIARAIELGLVGEVFNVETFVGGFEHPCRAWHSEEVVSGGAVYDWGSHHVDWLLRLYGGPPAQVITSSHKRVWLDVTNADQVTVWMRWPDGREASFRQSDVAAVRRPKFYVQGTAGTLEGHYRPLRFESLEPGRGYVSRAAHHAEAPVELRLVRHESGYGLVEHVLPPAPHPGWAFHRNLADHLLLGEPLAVPPAQSRAVVAVLEAAQRAGANGSAVVDLDLGGAC
jgi:predicted dehydrogenase